MAAEVGFALELLAFAGNVALAALLGTLIGLERQFRQHPAGLRTNALVSMGAALFVALTDLLGDANNRTRIAAYIVSGGRVPRRWSHSEGRNQCPRTDNRGRLVV